MACRNEAEAGTLSAKGKGMRKDDHRIFDFMIEHDAYHALYSRIYSTLLDDFDAADADTSIAEDWSNDTRPLSEIKPDELREIVPARSMSPPVPDGESRCKVGVTE